MKKKFFDKSLMIEGLTQLRLPGFIFLAISVLGSVLPAIFTGLNYCETCRICGAQSIEALEVKSVNIDSIAAILLPLIYIAPFVLCLVLFAFLNNRKDSDFYHALSSSRICLFLSFTAAIIIWLAVMVVSAVLPAYIIYITMGMYVNTLFVPYLIFTFFMGAILVMACMLLAMSVTGTILTNIILCGLILFLPRFIITITMNSISNSLPIISTNSGILGNVNNNIPVDFVYTFLFNSGLNKISLYASISAIVYTLILAAIYLVLACLFLHLRKSEVAGSSAPNRVLQHAYRCAITLPVALLIPYILTSDISQDIMKQFSENALYIISLAAFSLFVYYLYELLTTKSIRKMLKSTPVLLVIVVISILYGVSIDAAKKSILNFTPSASEISGITITQSSSTSNITYSYNYYKLKSVQLNDPVINKTVSEILAYDVNRLKSNEGIHNDNSNYYVGIHLKNGRFVARLIYTYKYEQQLEHVLYANNKYLRNSTDLPDDSSISSISIEGISDKKAAKQILDTLQSEYRALSQRDKQILCFEPLKISKYLYYSSCYLYGSYGTEKYESGIQITSLTPKTSALFAKLANVCNKDKVKSILSRFLARKSNNFTIYASLSPDGSSTSNSLSLFSSDNNTEKSRQTETKCIKIFLKDFDEKINLNQSFVHIDMQNGYSHYEYYLPVSKTEVRSLKALVMSKKK